MTVIEITHMSHFTDRTSLQILEHLYLILAKQASLRLSQHSWITLAFILARYYGRDQSEKPTLWWNLENRKTWFHQWFLRHVDANYLVSTSGCANQQRHATLMIAWIFCGELLWKWLFQSVSMAGDISTCKTIEAIKCLCFCWGRNPALRCWNYQLGWLKCIQNPCLTLKNTHTMEITKLILHLQATPHWPQNNGDFEYARSHSQPDPVSLDLRLYPMRSMDSSWLQSW